MAEALTLRGLDVTLIQRDKQLMPTLQPALAQMVYEEAVAHGVKVSLQETLQAFEGDQQVSAVVTDKGRYETDLVIVAAGVRPNTQFAEGFDKLGNGVLIVNEQQQTSIPDVFATALYNEMTLSQLLDIDISYAPPFNGVWDALLQVAKRYSK